MTPHLERADAVRQQPPAGLHVFKATSMQTTVERCTDFAAASHAIVVAPPSMMLRSKASF